MNPDQRNEIAASVAAHADLGPGYDEALAQGLVERIGEEIDRRVDSRLGRMPAPAPGQQPPYRVPYQTPAPAPAPPAHRHGSGLGSAVIGLGSIGLGLGATGIVTSHTHDAVAATLMVLLIWAAITVINIAYARRR